VTIGLLPRGGDGEIAILPVLTAISCAWCECASRGAWGGAIRGNGQPASNPSLVEAAGK
jgi:hypothetical protein